MLFEKVELSSSVLRDSCLILQCGARRGKWEGSGGFTKVSVSVIIAPDHLGL